MSLLRYPPPVDYVAQQQVFKDFLQNFRSFESASESAATEAIEGLHIDEDGTSDEYDFLEDMENGDVQVERRGKRPKLKYMQMLQDIADRVKTNIVIELDDLDTVRPTNTSVCDRAILIMRGG